MKLSQKYREYLLSETAGLQPEKVVERLIELGVISHRLCEQQVIRTEVEHSVREGAGRCEAMEEAALRLHCSFGKIRQAVYYKPKK